MSVSIAPGLAAKALTLGCSSDSQSYRNYNLHFVRRTELDKLDESIDRLLRNDVCARVGEVYVAACRGCRNKVSTGFTEMRQGKAGSCFIGETADKIRRRPNLLCHIVCTTEVHFHDSPPFIGIAFGECLKYLVSLTSALKRTRDIRLSYAQLFPAFDIAISSFPNTSIVRATAAAICFESDTPAKIVSTLADGTRSAMRFLTSSSWF